MTRFAALVLVVGVVVGCNRSKPTPEPSPSTAPAPSPGDAAAVAEQPKSVALPDAAPHGTEEQLRAGKHLGLVATEKPEIVSEELLRSIAGGKVKLDRFVDASHEVIVASSGGGSPCAPDDKKCLAEGVVKPRSPLAYIQAMIKKSSTEPIGDSALTCENTFFAAADPDFGRWGGKGDIDPSRTATPIRYATCSVRGDGEYAESFHVLFVPDDVRGVRLVAAVSSKVGGKFDWRAAVEQEAAAAVAGTAEIREDDLLGKWSGQVTTTSDVPADHATGTPAGKTEGHETVTFEIVRKDGKLFNLGRGPCCDTTPLALSRGPHGQLVDRSQQEAEVPSYSLAGDQLKVVTEIKGRYGGTSIGLFTRR
jgi:hypothetical protein